MISDDVWFEHAQSVSTAGLAAGAVAALIASLLTPRWAILVVLVQHVAALLAGGMVAEAGARWPGALAVYFGTQLIVALAAFILLRQVKTRS